LLEQLSTPPDAASRRLAIYRRTVQAHWRAALANAYPVMLALTGEAYFSTLAHAYSHDCPPCSGDLNAFGAHLAEFIDAWEKDSRYEYFGDIARLEWAVHHAWYAADAEGLSVQDWQQVDSEMLLASRLTIHPACDAIHSRHAIGDIWCAHQPGGADPQNIDIDTPAWALVVRPEWHPFVINQSRAAHEAFVALKRGCTFSEGIDVALNVDTQFDCSSQLRQWIAVRAVTGIA
jgi:hypothetical protein